MPSVLRVGLALVALLVVRAAPASQIHPEEVGLEETVASATIIVVVERADPELVEREVPVRRDGRTFEPFRYQLDRLVVVEVVHDPAARAPLGSTLEVAPGDLQISYGGHVSYAVYGEMESPVVETYMGSLDGTRPTGRFVAMLTHGVYRDEPLLSYAYAGAVESVEKLPEIRAMLGIGAPEATVVDTPEALQETAPPTRAPAPPPPPAPPAEPELPGLPSGIEK